MGLPEKAYFGLEEIEERWGLPRRDLVYLAENGILRVSLRVWEVLVEQGTCEAENGKSFAVPTSRERRSGLLDLKPRDAHRIFRDSIARIADFAAAGESYLSIIEPSDGIEARAQDLVVRREERDRIERDHRIRARAPGGRAPFEHRDGYKEIDLQGRTFHLGSCQAKVVRILHEAARAGAPWRHGKAVLGEAGSSCSRMADLFKTQKDWRTLILSDRKGRYRLNLPIP